MNNYKKAKNITIAIILLVGLLSVIFVINSYKNKNVKEYKEVHKIDSKRFKVYLEQENGDYSESKGITEWPGNDYRVNQSKTTCVDSNGNSMEDIIEYRDGVLYLTTKKSVFCNVYFDIKSDLTISVTTDNVEGLPTKNGYKATISCDTATATFNEKYQRIEISSLSSDETRCNLNYITDSAASTKLINIVENTANINSNGFRYSGQNPNNYIWFNNEMWRIIGLIPTCKNSDCSLNENLVKIIRTEPIGELSYHNSNSSTVWADGNTLYTLLNNYYYGMKDITGKSPCYMESSLSGICDYRGNGISNSELSYFGRMIEDVYWNVGVVNSLSKSVSASYSDEIKKISSKSAKIGLMNISDYGYASNKSNVSLENLASYTSTNWLFGKGAEWTLTPYSSNRYMLIFDYNGTILDVSMSSYEIVRPVLYLKSSVYVKKGTGSITDPYIIGM